jgi:hypothetical protein
MSIKFGEIDANQILENEYRIGVLERILDWILANNTAFVKPLTPEVISQIQQDVARDLKKKYPNSGIEIKR